VDVLYHDRPITGSPFRCQVFNSSQVHVRDLPPYANVGSSVEFDGLHHCLLSLNNNNIIIIIVSSSYHHHIYSTTILSIRILSPSLNHRNYAQYDTIR